MSDEPFVMLALICDAYANDGVFYVNGNEIGRAHV